MRSRITLFIMGVFLLLIAFNDVSSDKYFQTETLDDSIKLTSLSGVAPILNREPIVFPVIDSLRSGNLVSNNHIQNIAKASSAPTPPHIQASATLIVNLSSKKPLLEFGSDRRWPIASITKLMTAIVAAENIGFQKQVTITNDDILSEGNAGNFSEGEVFTIGDLVKAMLVSSSNDAAEAIARSYGRQSFINAMQEKSAELLMTDTTFADPTGLTSLNQSTEQDLIKMINYIITYHRDFLRVSTEKESQIMELTASKSRVLKNINKFSGQEDFLGGKTGYIDEAGGNLVSLFSHNGNTVLVIIFGSTDRFGDTSRLYEWAKSVL